MTLHQKHHIRLVLILIATIFYFLANIQRCAIPGAIFNLLQSDFFANASKITLLGAIFCYVYAFTQLIVGLLIDKIGGFKVIALGAVAFCLGAILFPHSSNLLQLYISRALVGFGGATFYLSTVSEVKKYAKDENFSLAVSYILFVGYAGGIVANAPFVLFVSEIGWRNTLYGLAYFGLFLTIIYFVALFKFNPIHIEKETKFSLMPYCEVLKKKENIYLYIFAAINYGVYYTLQTVIGKKFLEDFCQFEVHSSAIVLSTMAIISAFSGTITAFISKCINNKRDIIFKIFSLFGMFSMLLITIFLFFNIKTKIIAIILFIPSYIGSISPLVILSLYQLNRYELKASSVAIQNFSYFMMVGLLGMISGILMGFYEPKKIGADLIYSNKSYLLVFGLFLILSIIEVIYAFKIRDRNA